MSVWSWSFINNVKRNNHEGENSVIEKKKLTRPEVSSYPTLVSQVVVQWSSQVFKCAL